jgi:hypothetical protein
MASLRAIIAQDLPTFVKLAAQDRLGRSTVAVLNLLPVSRLIEAAELSILAAEPRAELARVAWVRAYLLGKPELMARAARILAEQNPPLAPYIAEIEEASGARRDHLITYMLLKHPRLGIRINGTSLTGYHEPQQDLLTVDRYHRNDNNWWCRFDVDRYRGEMVRWHYDVPVALTSASWWSRQPALQGIDDFSEVRDGILADSPLLALIDWQELAALSQVASGPQFLSERATAWAESETVLERLLGLDAEVREALHLAVRSTRYGCPSDGPHGAYSRRAFRILHYEYPWSEWTGRTPYWFN